MKRLNRRLKDLIYSLLPGVKPSFMVVGAQKAGTTSLYHYLCNHRKLIGSRPKEVHFFDVDEYFEKGTRWYMRHFKSLKALARDVTSFEANPNYLYIDCCAERLFEFNPNLRIIILLREPVARAFSAWNMYRSFRESGQPLPEILLKPYHRATNSGLEPFFKSERFPDFQEWIDFEFEHLQRDSAMYEPSLVRRGIYYPQVKRFVESFGWEQVLVIGSEDLGAKRDCTLNTILRFVGMPELESIHSPEARKHVIPYTMELDQYTLKRLEEFYAPHNEKLFEYLGKNVNW